MKANLNEEIAAKFREMRVKREYSQAEVAKKAGTSQADISSFESGNTNVSVDHLIRLTDAIGARLSISLE